MKPLNLHGYRTALSSLLYTINDLLTLHWSPQLSSFFLLVLHPHAFTGGEQLRSSTPRVQRPGFCSRKSHQGWGETPGHPFNPLIPSCGTFLFLNLYYLSNKSFCFSWICCMRRLSTPWSIGLGCHRQNMLPAKATFSTTCKRCDTVIFLINRMIQTLSHPSITTQISQCVLCLWCSKSTKT